MLLAPSCPGLSRASTSFNALEKEDVGGRDKPATTTSKALTERKPYAASAALAFSAIAWNAAGS
jgi:hypothetical protein